MVDPNPDFATDVRDDLMGLSLDAREVAAIVVFMRDSGGSTFFRTADYMDDADLVKRLRKLANKVEEEEGT